MPRPKTERVMRSRASCAVKSHRATRAASPCFSGSSTTSEIGPATGTNSSMPLRGSMTTETPSSPGLPSKSAPPVKSGWR
jgi:hypothetical protein